MSNLGIALCGAQGTGKTTLAKAFAEFTGADFIASKASEIYRKRGFTVKTDIARLSFEERINIQNEILDVHLEDISKSNNHWISDRCALDFLSYTSLYTLTNTDPDIEEMLTAYTNKCFAVSNQNYNILMLIQPGIPYVETDNRPPPSVNAQEVYNNNIIGMMNNPKLETFKTIVPRYCTDMTLRLKCLENAISRGLSVGEWIRNTESRGEGLIS